MPYSFFLDRYENSYVNIMSAFVNFVKTGDESLEPALGIDGKVTIFIGESKSFSYVGGSCIGTVVLGSPSSSAS